MKSNTTTTQSAPSRGRDAHEERSNEEPRKDYADMDEVSEADEAGPSQGTEVQTMIIGSLSNKKRHVLNKQKVTESYSSTKTDVQNSITAFFDAHEDQADAVHTAQLKRLADLTAVKATIEAQMTTKLAHLRALYDAHSRELTSVVASRIKELK
ncbi:hypothetical protein OPT61_g9210 [Boeremia exigua]|uniref:Uncharacterized protein n=1 Tax=Boeremia exigua TaxID=749465 RepID=A0ACC2HV24_9PLEO|nr:hypothetical protein OPT61_g9210 [Boeremia exigua]